eukprot:jgi/Botrbrau1/8549/Bobra.0359s0013.1
MPEVATLRWPKNYQNWQTFCFIAMYVLYNTGVGPLTIKSWCISRVQHNLQVSITCWFLYAAAAFHYL